MGKGRGWGKNLYSITAYFEIAEKKQEITIIMYFKYFIYFIILGLILIKEIIFLNTLYGITIKQESLFSTSRKVVINTIN